ncbi:MAG TPA: PAS domain S-box protein [Noviherbaspirillum sp.]|uniref:PAS domain S-box protein n=1 Tax=Noviherbaspirillum sp. TaxID=1926288 RepID=UPI002B483120|nr:PAS domain S-box protein [Noviherbaspirillum sp.]HJV85622.1 PAS domain S-box protein [Noviherbaspirillum sp.]
MTTRPLTLRRAIVLAVVVSLVVPTMLISGSSWLQRYYDGIRRQTKELSERNADVLASGMQEPLWNINRESGRALVATMIRRNEDIVSIEVRGNHLGMFVSAEHPERRTGFTAVAERAVAFQGKPIGAVRIEVGSTRLRAIMMKRLWESMAAVLAQVALSIVLILILLERRLVRPLQELGAGAHRLANRQLDEPFTWRRLDEIGMLSQRMEETRLDLRKLFDELERKNRELEQDIDKRKHVERELYEREQALTLSEAKFAGAFQCNPDSITITRMRDGKLIEMNQTFEAITGYTRDETIGRTTVELAIWHDHKQRVALLRALQSGRIVRNFEWDMQNKRGQLRKCLSNATIFSAGSERYILCTVRDVTDQRLLEAQKAEADRALLRLAQDTRDLAGESFFELLVSDLASALRTDCAFIGVTMPDSPHRIRTIAAHIHGSTADNFDYVAFGTPSQYSLEGNLCVFAAGLQADFPGNGLLSKYRWESCASAPLRDAAGNAVGVLTVMHSEALGNPDLVKSLLQIFSERASAELERKRAEEELRSSELRFSTIFQSSPVAMLVTQVRGNYIVKDVNRAFEKLFLRNREQVIGRNTEEVGLYCDTADRALLITEMKETGATDSGRDIWMTRGDGSKVLVRLSGHTFFLGGDKFGILACVDVTDKRRVENQIRELNATLEQRVIERTEALQQANEELAYTLDTLNKAQEELVRSEKLAALGSLVAGIAHELNTPIGNSMMVASTLANQTHALSATYQENGLKRSILEGYISDAAKASDILVRNLQRAANLVNSFKQVAVDQTSSQRRRFSVAEVVSEIMLTMWPTLKKTSFIVKQNIPDSLVMDSYPGPLGQVITNLVNNALLHGFEGRQDGTVSVTGVAVEDGWLELVVRDNGIGIPAGNLNRIFDPFFTTKLGAGGSGLGLNITHNIVTGVLGGRIRVQSEVGAGSEFVLTLPMVAPQMLAEGEDDRVRAQSSAA